MNQLRTDITAILKVRGRARFSAIVASVSGSAKAISEELRALRRNGECVYDNESQEWLMIGTVTETHKTRDCLSCRKPFIAQSGFRQCPHCRKVAKMWGGVTA